MHFEDKDKVGLASTLTSRTAIKNKPIKMVVYKLYNSGTAHSRVGFLQDVDEDSPLELNIAATKNSITYGTPKRGFLVTKTTPGLLSFFKHVEGITLSSAEFTSLTDSAHQNIQQQQGKRNVLDERKWDVSPGKINLEKRIKWDVDERKIGVEHGVVEVAKVVKAPLILLQKMGDRKERSKICVDSIEKVSEQDLLRKRG